MVWAAYPTLTSGGGLDTIVTGESCSPRLVTAVDPNMSDTKTTAVMLNTFAAVPGGMWVVRSSDADAEDDSMVTATELATQCSQRCQTL